MHFASRFLAVLFTAALLLFGAGALAAPTTPTADFTDNGDGTVTHKTTGLTWKRCAEGMTWTGSDCAGTATTHTYDQAKALTSSFAGKSDWRLPTIAELVTLVEREYVNPAINATIFPRTPDKYFWSDTVYSSSSSVWGVGFSNGDAYSYGKSGTGHVRLVRGGQLLDSYGYYTPTSDFTDNGDGTVTHKKTSLTWKRCSEGQAWSGSVCTGTASTHTWAQATVLTSSYAGKSDWRLPTQNELLTIIEWRKTYPAINEIIFPGTPSEYFWSASAYAGRSGGAWLVRYYDSSSSFDTSNAYLVRLVRGGQSVGSSSTAVVLTGLTLSCPASIAAGASGSCTASSAYSDGSSKAATPTWSSSDSATLSVSTDGKLSAKQPASDTSVTVTASYVENGVSKTATATVAVKAATTTATGACAGSTSNLSAITIPGDATKHFGDALQVDYCLKNFNSATNFDIYVAVQLPDRTMMFMQTTGFFQTPAFTTKVAPYLSNTLIPDKSGTVLSISVLPLTLPTGTYTFYAIPVLAGGNVYDGFQWIGNLARQDVNIVK